MKQCKDCGKWWLSRTTLRKHMIGAHGHTPPVPKPKMKRKKVQRSRASRNDIWNRGRMPGAGWSGRGQR